ncbi:hypothetical protein NDU88_004272 [Pleurodeles waltl]|uniref:Uncharacterized protein n=1 Tax=Pleurodeles waltl TaxID=8319 RepID=A0AAV7PKI6_PLEWA|nr:hypothetical protein NDU88_004272 [Pleurodeles waltl]
METVGPGGLVVVPATGGPRGAQRLPGAAAVVAVLGLRGWVAYFVGCWPDWRLRLEPLVRRGGGGSFEGDCAG